MPVVEGRRPVSVVLPRDIAYSDFSRRHGRGAQLRDYSRLDAFVPAIVEEGVREGTGDYEGLRFVYATGGGTSYPWPITGTIEPSD